MTPEQEFVRAGKAREIIDSDLFREMRDSIKAQIEDQIRKAPIADQTMHTRLIMLSQLWHAVESWFEQVAQSGEMAQVQIAEEERRRTFFERMRVVGR